MLINIIAAVIHDNRP